MLKEPLWIFEGQEGHKFFYVEKIGFWGKGHISVGQNNPEYTPVH